MAYSSDVASAARPVVRPMVALTGRVAIHRREATRTIAKTPLAAMTLTARRFCARQRQRDVAMRKRLMRRQDFLTKAESLMLFRNPKSALHSLHDVPDKRAIGRFK